MIDKTATFSPGRIYRYSLSRIWSTSKSFVNFVCLNPSTADENVDDPTIRRCVRFADSWGYGGMVMTNLYAYRSKDPKKLTQVADPVGPLNDSFLRMYSAMADKTILAWGANAREYRVVTVIQKLTNMHYLELTKLGYPKHPLYLKKNLKPIKYRIPWDICPYINQSKKKGLKNANKW